VAGGGWLLAVAGWGVGGWLVGVAGGWWRGGGGVRMLLSHRQSQSQSPKSNRQKPIAQKPIAKSQSPKAKSPIAIANRQKPMFKRGTSVWRLAARSGFRFRSAASAVCVFLSLSKVVFW